MRWSFQIATIAGIPIYLHGTFLALLAFLFISDWMRGQDLAAALAGSVFMLAIFATIVLHELGHALAARRYGIKTRDITLLPIGGLARLERMPDVPRQELWVALAGPAVNFALALLTYVVAITASVEQPELTLDDPSPLNRFMAINLWLALFNLIPAFPMDGGRALRALLAERFEYVRATEIAAHLGQGLAFVFGFIGLFFNPFLVFIALFVWMGASSEASSVALRTALSGIPVRRAMITDFRTVSVDDTLQRATELVLGGTQRDFPVLDDGGQLVGVLTRDALMKALAEQGLASSVRTAMTPTFETVSTRDMLDHAFQRLQECQCPVLPVVDDGRLVGLLTADNVGEFVMIRGALQPVRR